MNIEQRLMEAFRAGDVRLDAAGNLHVGETGAPTPEGIRLRESQASAAVRLQEAERQLEEMRLREAEKIGMQLGGSEAFAKAFAACPPRTGRFGARGW